MEDTQNEEDLFEPSCPPPCGAPPPPAPPPRRAIIIPATIDSDSDEDEAPEYRPLPRALAPPAPAPPAAAPAGARGGSDGGVEEEEEDEVVVPAAQTAAAADPPATPGSPPAAGPPAVAPTPGAAFFAKLSQAASAASPEAGGAGRASAGGDDIAALLRLDVMHLSGPPVPPRRSLSAAPETPGTGWRRRRSLGSALSPGPPVPPPLVCPAPPPAGAAPARGGSSEPSLPRPAPAPREFAGSMLSQLTARPARSVPTEANFELRLPQHAAPDQPAPRPSPPPAGGIDRGLLAQWDAQRRAEEGTQRPSPVELAAPIPAGAPDVPGATLADWGIPAEVCAVYADLGIAQLYPWQRCCLADTGAVGGDNLIYCAPTSGGKTLVAEVLMIRRLVAMPKRKVLIVLPYVALVAEKASYFAKILAPLSLRVGTLAAGRGNRLLIDDVAVCTMERANSVVNVLLEMGRLDEIGMVIVDELHQIADADRGYLLEVMLTKLLYASTEDGVQFVAMSATLPNASVLARWLREGWYFATNYRPVPLREYICCDGRVERPGTKGAAEPPREVAPAEAHDGDRLLALCRETVLGGNSVLIFCASKRSAETSATYVARHFAQQPAPELQLARGGGDAGPQRAAAVQLLRRSPYGMDPILEEAVPFGVAYHHAGLTFEEREVIEAAFRDGTVCVLACTTTLAAGVNLPARRVIFRSAKIGIAALDVVRYKQAAGRAGRAGLDEVGESFLLGRPAERQTLKGLVCGRLPAAASSLRPERRGMSRALGEAIAAGVVASVYDVQRFVTCTFFAAEAGYAAVHHATKAALAFLERNEFIAWDPGRSAFRATLLGQACFASGLGPDEALSVYGELSRARRHFIMDGDLHLVYHCTPADAGGVEPEWSIYGQLLAELGPKAAEVAAAVGVSDSFLGMARHQKPAAEDPATRMHKRFYAAMVLHELIRERPLAQVAERFMVPRGSLQRLMESAGQFSGMVGSFCERLNWWGFQPLIQKLQVRIKDGVENDIVPLMQIPNMKSYRARALYRAGYRTVAAVAAADAADLEAIVAKSHPFQQRRSRGGPRSPPGRGAEQRHQGADTRLARMMIKGAKGVLLQAAEEKEGELREAAAALRDAVAGEDEEAGAPPEPPPCPLTPHCQETVRRLLRAPDSPPPAAAAAAAKRRRITVGATFAKAAGRGGAPPPRPPQPQPQSSSARQPPSLQPPRAAGPPPRLSPNVYYCPRAKPGKAPPPPRPPAAATDARGGVLALAAARARGAEDVLQGERAGESNGDLSFTCNLLGHDAAGSDAEARFLATWEEAHSFSFHVVCSPDRAAAVDPFGIAVCFGSGTATYLVLRDSAKGHSDAAVTARRLEVLRRRFAAPSATRTAFDCKQQCKALLRGGVEEFGRLMDPRIAAWMISPEERLEGGAANTLEVLFRKEMKGCSIRGHPKTAEEAACKSAVQSWVLMKHLLGSLRYNQLVEPFLRVEMPFVPVLAGMEERGVLLSRDLLESYESEMQRKAERIQADARRLTGGAPWELTCPQDCARALFDNQGLPLVEVRRVRPEPARKRQRAETRSTSAAVLAKLAELRPDNPLPNWIREHRTLHGWLAKYVRPIPRFASPDGRVRAEMQHTATGTGRLAVHDPSLQTIPHPFTFTTVDGRALQLELRRAFVAPAGHVLVAADYSQIEVRLMAHFSGDAALVDFLRGGGDVFRRIAGGIHCKAPDTVTPEERKAAKTMCYGILYGKGATSLSEDLDCTPEEAAVVLDSFKRTYPGVAAFIKSTQADCRRLGYVETVHGRRRYLPAIYSRQEKERAFAERQAVNTVCQGSAADVIKTAMVRVEGALRRMEAEAGRRVGAQLLQIHDEVLLEARADSLPAVARMLREEMEGAVQLAVPTPVNLSAGPTWGDLSPLTV